MTEVYRFGLQILPADPFWVQVREAVVQRAHQLGFTIVQLAFDGHELTGDDMVDLMDGLVAHELDAFIGQRLSRRLAQYLLNAGLPIIYAEETNLRHPRLTAPHGLYDAAKMVGDYLAVQYKDAGRVLMIASVPSDLPTVVTRVSGFNAALSHYPTLTVKKIDAPWRYDEACAALRASFADGGWPFDPAEPLDAIFGLSDPIALAAIDVGRELGFVTERTRIAGINGDPLALAAIVAGRMHATVEISARDLGWAMIEQACRAARGEPLAETFPYQMRLVTQENVAQTSAEKLIAIAELPNRLVDVNRRQEEQRVRQLETGLAINQHMGVILDDSSGIYDLADLIRTGYGYDDVQIFLWEGRSQTLILTGRSPEPKQINAIPLATSTALGQALLQNRSIYIPDTERSQRFAADPYWPATRSRVIFPIRQGQRTLGVLDLHSRRRLPRTQSELDGLQILSDQLGNAMQNARLYADAQQALAEAERANQLRSRLLANVSHELREPLNVILGYSQAATAAPNIYGMELPPELRQDFHHIEQSGQHLARVINDLIDISQAESGALSLFPQSVNTYECLTEVFHSFKGSIDEGLPNDDKQVVAWHLQLPDSLPAIVADLVRLRQILFNLLSNAAKFTDRGRVVLGALATPAHLHIWVEDTGTGIPAEIRAHIHEAFVTAEETDSALDRARTGIGLGLSMTHYLVKLHHGRLRIDSRPDQGTVCHIWLPLPVTGGADEGLRDAEQADEQAVEQPLSALLEELLRHTSELVQQTAAYIRARHDDELSRQGIADAMGVSPNYISRTFRAETGLTPWQYLNRYRVAQAQALLLESELSVTDVAGEVGFNDPAYFSRVFRRATGKSPVAFRNQ